MKLLFDQNISFRIVARIKEYFPDAIQVRECGLENKSDSDIWNFARENDYAIVTFDADFYDLSLIYGIPPKIIWLRIGNTSTVQVAETLKTNFIKISHFMQIENKGVCLEIT